MVRKIVITVACLLTFSNTSAGSFDQIAEREVKVWKAMHQSCITREFYQDMAKVIEHFFNVPDASEVIFACPDILIRLGWIPGGKVSDIDQQNALPVFRETLTTLSRTCPFKFDTEKLIPIELERQFYPYDEIISINETNNIKVIIQRTYAVIYGGSERNYDLTALFRANAIACYGTLKRASDFTSNESWKIIKNQLVSSYQYLDQVLHPEKYSKEGHGGFYFLNKDKQADRETFLGFSLL
jgi:hypothetical protein